MRLGGFGLLAIALFVSTLLLGDYIGFSTGYYEGQTQRYTHQDREATSRRIAGCYRQAVSLQGQAECVEKAIQASHEYRRAEEDLNAQRDMAKWARWLWIVTIGQVPLTALGVLLLLRSIRQGQETFQAFVAVERPKLVVEVAWVTNGESGKQVRVGLKIKNIGKSWASVQYVGWTESKLNVLSRYVVMRPSFISILAGDSDIAVIETGADADVQPFIVGIVQYRSAFFGRHKTHFCVKTHWEPQDSLGGINSTAELHIKGGEWPNDT